MRQLIAFASTTVLAVACGGASSGGSSSQPPPGDQPPPGCGVTIFKVPACEQALDYSCCPLQVECAKDPGCVWLTDCLNRCDAATGGQDNDSCSNRCALESHVAFCRQHCRGQGDECQTACTLTNSLAEPMAKYLLIAQCSKDTRYPDGLNCSR